MGIWLLVVALVLVVLLVSWLYRRLAVAPGWPRPWRVAVALTLVVLTLLTVTGLRGGPAWLPAPVARGWAFVGSTWLALAWYLILALIPVAVVSVATRLFARTDDAGTRRRVNRVGVPVALLVALAVTAWGVVSAWTPALTPVTVRSAQLPAAFDGTRVAVITDLHVGPVRGPDFTRRVVQEVNAASPDLVLLVGDLVDGPASRFGDALAPLTQLRAPLGVFAVTGNHEMYTGTVPQWLATWRADGIDVLTNTPRTLLRGEDRIHLAGVNDVSGTGDFAPDYARAMARIPVAEFTLLLAHQPVAARSVQGVGVDLQVSGHTHGGQLWPFRSLVLLQQPVIDGLHAVGDVPVLTSRGAGTWGPPVRVGAAAQIPIVTLTRG